MTAPLWPQGGIALYDLHTFTLAVDMTSPGAADALANIVELDYLLGPRRVAEAISGQPLSTIVVHSAEDFCDPSGQLLSEYPSQYGGMIRTWRGPERRKMVSASNWATGHLQGSGNSVLTLYPAPAEGAWIVGDLLLLLLDHAVTAHGQCFCHAASMASPDGSSCVLLHGPSGAGKSTTTAALAGFGFKMMSDDTAALIEGAGEASTRAWGLPRGLRMHRRSVAFLPAIGALIKDDAWDEEDEQMIDRDRLVQHGIAVECDPLPISAVFTLRRAGHDKTSTMVRVRPQFEGLRDLLADNISANEHGFFVGHERRLDLFSQLVACTPCFLVEIAGAPISVARAINDSFDQTCGAKPARL